jgi:RimJ/RimL family protein N-acetyltransferase
MPNKKVVRLRHIRAHWILDGVVNNYDEYVSQPDPRLPMLARRFWNRAGLSRCCDGGVVAKLDGEIIGFCRYCTYSRKRKESNIRTIRKIYMAGTWVSKKHRRSGLAKRMWRLIFRQLRNGTRVEVVSVSRSGAALVQHLQAAYPHLKFKHVRNYW